MITRDSLVWIVAALGALVTYLVNADTPPTEWHYAQWLQFGSFVLAWVAGKLSSSVLAGATTDPAKTVSSLGGLLRLTKEDS